VYRRAQTIRFDGIALLVKFKCRRSGPEGRGRMASERQRGGASGFVSLSFGKRLNSAGSATCASSRASGEPMQRCVSAAESHMRRACAGNVRSGADRERLPDRDWRRAGRA